MSFDAIQHLTYLIPIHWEPTNMVKRHGKKLLKKSSSNNVLAFHQLTFNDGMNK